MKSGRLSEPALIAGAIVFSTDLAGRRLYGRHRIALIFHTIVKIRLLFFCNMQENAILSDARCSLT